MDTPAVGNKVKITMYGDELQTYENQVSTEVCGADSGACSMGSKVIAVIGGELDIAGTEPACPSWEVSARGVCVCLLFQRVLIIAFLLPSPHPHALPRN